MSKECIVKIINVSDIVEFPTELGNRCLLLTELGVNPYIHTEEEILEVLEKIANDSQYLDICLKSSRCQGFYEEFTKGVTPFFDKDKIRVIEYNGKYWVDEGKHRICLAKRMGVSKIKVEVTQLKEDVYTTLEPLGHTGHYNFDFTMSIKDEKREYKGKIGLIWLGTIKDYNLLLFKKMPITLDWSFRYKNEWTILDSGIKVKVETSSETKKRLFQPEETIRRVHSEVIIENNHHKTRVWLFAVNANEEMFRTPLGKLNIDNLYRFGCWRKIHERMLERIIL